MAKMTDIFTEITEVLNLTLKQWIDERHRRTGESQRTLSVEVGKALIMTGCFFIGPAIDVQDPNVGLRPGQDCIEAFRKLARANLAEQGELP